MASIVEFKPRKAGSRRYEEPAAIIDFKSVREARSAALTESAGTAGTAEASLPGKDR